MNAPNTTPIGNGRSLQLTARDLRLLADVLERPPVPIDVIASRHFSARKTALNRARLLVRAGYLTCELVQLLDQPAPIPFYSPTPKARDALTRLSLSGERLADA